MLAFDVSQSPHCSTHILLAANPSIAAARLPPVAIGQSALSQGNLSAALPEALGEIGFSEVHDFKTLLATLARGPRPDLILLDPSLPGVGGLTGVLYLRSQYSETPLVVVAAEPDAIVMRRCIQIGVAGFIPANAGSNDIGEAIRLVLDGEIWTPQDTFDGPDDPEANEILRRLTTLTPQQVRVLTMLTQGLLNKQIAYELTVSEATVKAHVSAILQKLGVESRTQAVAAVGRVQHRCFAKRATA